MLPGCMCRCGAQEEEKGPAGWLVVLIAGEGMAGKRFLCGWGRGTTNSVTVEQCKMIHEGCLEISPFKRAAEEM